MAEDDSSKGLLDLTNAHLSSLGELVLPSDLQVRRMALHYASWCALVRL